MTTTSTGREADAADSAHDAAHVGDEARVRGRVRYTADLVSPQALHAAFLLSSEAHARVLRIDTSQARAVPGVMAVLTGEDTGDLRFGRSVQDYPVLATDRVLFVGQRVAAVAAVDADTARRAADLIEVEYEPLEAVFDPEAALADDAPALHPAYDDYVGGRTERPGPNVQGTDHAAEGDLDAAFEACDEVYEHVFAWPRLHAAPIEPHACIVTAGDDGVDVVSTHKEPNKLRIAMAKLAGRDVDEVRVHPVTLGGDFGSKGAPYIEGACYFLSVATGRPVRAVMSYFEELTSTSSRHAGTATLRTGLREGRIHAFDAETVFDGGAFAAIKALPTHTVRSVGYPLYAYQPANRDERVVSVYTNNLPGGHVRAPGVFQAMFAGESHIDMIARARGDDPLSFRIENAEVEDARAVLRELGDVVAQWRTQPPDGSESAEADGRGIGVSVFQHGAGAGASIVSCEVTPRGVTLSVGAPDQGAGMYAVFADLAAEVLEVPVDRVTIRSLGADAVLTDSGAGGSRVTAVAGRACVEACRAVLAETGPPTRGGGGGGTPYWIASRLEEMGRPAITASGGWTTERGDPPPVPPAFGALAIELSVDTATGKLTLHRAQLVVAAGRVINRIGHRGQLEGGFVFGLSQTLFEELSVESGQVVASSLGDYKLASAGDVPPLEIRYLTPEPVEGDGPLEGARAVGELANLGVPAAVANAIDDAVGVRIRELPITAERVWQAIRASTRPDT